MTSIISSQYCAPLVSLFRKHTDPAEAVRKKKYMIDQFEFAGLPKPRRNELEKQFISKYGYPDEGLLEDVARYFWVLPEREFQYFVQGNLLLKFAKKADIDRIHLYEELITEKSWWDTVDFLASNMVGTHFKLYPELIPAFTQKWMDSGNMWLQRTCLLFQLKYKKDTDIDLLYSFIDRLSESNEFFIQKAIGWILREYSKTDPLEVERFIAGNDLKPLSTREGLKWMKNKGIIE